MKRISIEKLAGALLLLLMPCLLQAQQGSNLQISASFENTALPAVFTQLENDYPLRFYYEEEDLPNRKLTATFEQATVDEVMRELLSGSVMSYLRYRDYAVVILPRQVVDQVYTADFYEALEETIVQPEEAEADKQLTIGDISALAPSGRATISGIITDADTGEPIIGATVYWPQLQQGTASDIDGSFSMEVPTGKQELLVQFVGYQDISRPVLVLSDGTIDLQMAGTAIDLGEVVVEAEAADANVQRAQVGVEALDMETIKELPSFLGEADVIKSLLLLPGVSTIGEGATGFNVRGGEVDQNLIQMNEGFVFNASHALGFFSTFNADLVQRVELYKGNIPAQFGGRLASVLDVEMRDGDFEKFGLKGGVGPISSRISFETPVVKGKSSLIGGFRSSYLNWILGLTQVKEVKNSSAFFYDANLRYTHKLGEKHTLTLSGYSSYDDFVYNKEFGFDYNTLMGQIMLRSIYSDKLYDRFTITYSQYDSQQEDLDGTDTGRLENDISYIKVKEQLTWLPVEGVRVDGGAEAIRYEVNPGSQMPLDEESQISSAELDDERGLETAAFLNADWAISPAFQLMAGLRFNYYRFLGPSTVYEYENPERPEFNETIGTTEYGDGDNIASYSTLEPRFSMRYRLTSSFSVKAGYSRTSQFINQIFNSDSPTPNSQWQLSTSYIEPMRSHNYTFGIFKNLDDNLWETSAEVYYRDIDQLFDYKDFADLTVNNQLETELLDGIGRAYGLELSLKKKEGRFNGWISYTYSRSERQIEGINRGNWYPSNFDIPHNLSFIFNWQPNQRNTLTFNFNYSRGRPATYPLGNFQDPSGLVIPLYSERNQLRVPDYHRLDIAYTLGQSYNKTRRVKTSWTISLYNVYARRNAFSVFFTQAPFQGVQANKLSVLGSVFPSVTMNFEFL